MSSPRFFFYIQSYLRDTDLANMCADSILAMADPRVARVVIAVEQSTDPDPRHVHVAPGEQTHPGSNHPMISKEPCTPCWCWENSVGQIRSFLRYAQDAASHGASPDDIVIRLDADSYFSSTETLDSLSGSNGVDAFGFHHVANPGDVVNRGCVLGDGWTHMSGFFIAMRRSIAEEIGSLSDDRLKGIRSLMVEGGNLCQNEDVAISFLLGILKKSIAKLPWSFCGNFEDSVIRRVFDKVYHLNGAGVGSFAGFPCGNKWEIPAVLRREGIIP